MTITKDITDGRMANSEQPEVIRSDMLLSNTAGELGLQLIEEEEIARKGYKEFGDENLKLAEEGLPLTMESWPTWEG